MDHTQIKRKYPLKKSHFWAVKRPHVTEKLKPSKGASVAPTNKFQLLCSVWNGDGREIAFFLMSERGNSHISHPSRPWRLIFEHGIQLWILYRLVQNGTIFAFS